MVDKGVVWNLGKVFFDDRQVFGFNLLPEEGTSVRPSSTCSSITANSIW
jgi:hypothetical protein